MQNKVRHSIIEEIDPPASEARHLLKDAHALSHKANIIGFSVFSMQVVAMVVICVLFFFNVAVQIFIKGSAAGSANFLELFDRYDTLPSLLLNMLAYFCYMGVPFGLLLFCLKKRPADLIPVGPIRKKRWLPVAAGVVIAISVFSALVGEYLDLFLGFLHLRITSPDMNPPTNPALIVLYVLFFCGLAPLCEEFIFRGAILHELRRYGDGFAVVISALLFAMMHGNLAQFPLALLVGLALGFFVLWFRSIWATVILHACVNGFATLSDYITLTKGNVAGGLVYLGIGFLLMAAIVVGAYVLFRKRGFRSRFPSLFQSEMPVPYLFKRAFLNPGMIVFTIEFVFLCAQMMSFVP